MSWKRWALTILSFAAAIGVSIYLVVKSWSGAHGVAALPLAGHLLAIGMMTVEVCSRVLKLYYTAVALHIPFSISGAFRTNLGGDFGAGITPSRSGSEPARFLILSEARMRPAASILLLFMEMLLEVISMLVIAIVLSLAFPNAGRIVGGVFIVAVGYSAFVVVLGFAGFALSKRASGPPPRWARFVGLNADRWRRIQAGLRELRDRVATVRTANRGMLAWASLLSVMHILARVAVLPMIVMSYDRTVEVAPLLLWSLAIMYGANAAPAPAGGGLIEFVFSSSLGGIIPAQYFAATLIWWRFYSFYALILLGAIVAGRTVMRALRGEGDDEKPVAILRTGT